MTAENLLEQAFSIIENEANTDGVVVALRDLLNVDQVVYHSSKLGTGPAVPYIRVTYSAAWIKRYLQMGYGDIDPVVREGFKRTLPFDWKELVVENSAELTFMSDAAAHGVGPHGYSIPVTNKHGYRGLFTVCYSKSEQEWVNFLAVSQPSLVQIANRLHARVVAEIYGKQEPHLTARELECLRWVALGKDATEIAIILNISPHTTRDHLKSIYYKLDCVSSAQAVSKAIRLGLIS